MNEQPELLVRLARSLARSKPEVPLPARLCAAYSELVGAEGGSISMDFASTERVILCATDDQSARIEDAQDVLREGPSLDAFRTGLAVTRLSPEEQHDRWPLLEALLESDFPDTFLHAFPMTSEAHVIGVVMVYRTRVPELAMRTDQAEFLANAVGVALLGELGSHSVTEETWSSRDRVDQATGMVAAQLGVAPADARAVLRAHAYAHDTSLAEVSTWVLARRFSFADPNSSDGSDA